MHATRHTALSGIVASVGAVALVAGASTTAAIVNADATALIMGGTGRADPADFPLYVEHVTDYYLHPNTACDSAACEIVPVFTPEEAFPIYGGLEALTWKD